MDTTRAETHGTADDMTTREVARQLGLAVRSVQLMVDRGDLQAWRTAGGHRRIFRASVESWLSGMQHGPARRSANPSNMPAAPQPSEPASASARRRASDSAQPAVVLIEDSVHFQNIIRLLMKHSQPEVGLHVAADAVSGLALCGAIRPDVLIIDILLPGMDGAAIVQSVRSQPLFKGMKLLVVTALDAAGRAPYEWALAGLPVIEKQNLTRELPVTLSGLLETLVP